MVAFSIYNAYAQNKKKRAEEAKRTGNVEPPQAKEETKGPDTLQDVLRKLNEQAQREQHRTKKPPVAQIKSKQKPLVPQSAPVMVSRTVENVKEENPTTAYDIQKFEHVDSSMITTEVQVRNFDLRQAVINSIILERPEW